MRRGTLSDDYCSIARASAQIADAWTFLILRELFLSNRTFEGLRRQTRMAPTSLSHRLRDLENAGIVSRRAPTEKPRKAVYDLTQKGLELWPVLVAMKQWGDKWFGPWDNDDPPVSLEHKGHGHRLVVQMVCATCGEPVAAQDSVPRINAAFAADRAHRDVSGKAARKAEARE